MHCTLIPLYFFGFFRWLNLNAFDNYWVRIFPIRTRVPFIIKKFTYIAIILGHGKFIARRCHTYWPNCLNFQATHAHHFWCCFPAIIKQNIRNEWLLLFFSCSFFLVSKLCKQNHLSIEWSLTLSWQNLHVNNLPQQAARSLQFLL